MPVEKGDEGVSGKVLAYIGGGKERKGSIQGETGWVASFKST